MSVKLRFEVVDIDGTPTGHVASLRMPIALDALVKLTACITAAYGPGCVCREEPDGWLRVDTPKKEDSE